MKVDCAESKNEVLDDVVQSYVSKLGTQTKKAKDEEHESSSESEPDGEDCDLYYYSRPDKCYKVFDPASKTWSSRTAPPSEEEIEKLRGQQEEEQKLINIIKHDIAGDESPVQPVVRKDSSVNHDKIVTEAAKEVLEGTPMTAEELVSHEGMSST